MVKWLKWLFKTKCRHTQVWVYENKGKHVCQFCGAWKYVKDAPGNYYHWQGGGE